MKKIIFVFCLVSNFCWSQKQIEVSTIKEKAENTKYVSLDSLQVIYNYNAQILDDFIDTKSASKLLHPFLKVLKHQKKIHSQRNNKDKEGLNLIQIKTILDLIVNVHARNHSIDSTSYFLDKITELTNDPKIIAESYGRLGYAYSVNNMMVEAIGYFEKGLNIKKQLKDKKKLIAPLVDITDCLIELESYEHAKHHIIELTQAIESNPESKHYENFKQLDKIMQAKLLMVTQKHKEALQILNKVDTIKIEKKQLKRRYFGVLRKTHEGLKNFALGELYLDKEYKNIKNRTNVSNIEYYIEKLSYALLANNSKKADAYFKKITKIVLNNKNFKRCFVLSRYYASKKEFQKAFLFLESAWFLKNSNDRFIAKNKIDVDQYYIKYNKQLQEITQLSDSKDEVISKNRSLYINTTLFIVFISFTIIALLIAIYYVSRAFRKKTEYQNEVKILSEKTILESKQRFLENMSHEIKTPITSIMGYLTLLQENGLNVEKRKKYTTRAYANTQKMITALNSFLTLLRAEEGKLSINKKTTLPFNQFMKEIIFNYLPDFEVKKMHFYYKTNAKDSLNINYDLESLEIILNNLISNAIKYSNANKNIYLNIYFSLEGIEIIIRDEGFGIPEEDKEMIFTRFYQTKQNISTGGFGIGLSLLAELVNKLNGSVRVESEINVGSIFYVNLPYELNNFTLHTNSLKKEFDLISIEKYSKED